MATEPVTETSTALATVGELTPPQLFAPGVLRPIVDRIKSEVRAIETDISTEEGRKAIRSLVRKIASSKTFIDEQRTALVGDEKRRLAAIDAEGREVWKELEALQAEVRKPLTEWEEAEERRKSACESRIVNMTDVTTMTFSSLDSLERASILVDQSWDYAFGLEFAQKAGKAHEKALLHLQSEKKRLLQIEADRAEAERLRLEAEENARIERERKIAEDARVAAEFAAKRREEAQAREAKQREDDLAAAAAAEKTRLERERLDAEDRLAKAQEQAERDRLAAEERERKAEADRIERERKAEADRIEAARKVEADRVEAAKQAERDRDAAVDAERKRVADARKADEEATKKRMEDQKHRGAINRTILAKLVDNGIEPLQAKRLIELVARQTIPHISITY
jgi:colicin import membrane protein